LGMEYQANLPLADIKYRGKVLELSYLWGRVEKDEAGRYCIPAARWELGDPFNGGTKSYVSVIVYIRESELPKFAIATSRPVVRGRCKGTRTVEVGRFGPQPQVVVEDGIFVR
jgi:hypothetical protein